MKEFLRISILLLMLWVKAGAQHLSNDTVVCIIDTAKSYVSFKVNPIPDRAPDIRWQISIKGHYFDYLKNLDNFDSLACIVFEASSFSRLYGKEGFKGPYKIRKSKKYIKQNYLVRNEKWIHKQTDLQLLGQTIGRYPFSMINFIVFKEDLKKVGKNLVEMHRVLIGYCEVEIDNE